MPHCAVIWCNNQSKNVNKKNNGVSYHKFPQDPHVKDKWIRATGKYNWFPQKHDTICSEHFDEDSLMKKASKTFLFLEAIPTLKLHPIFKEIDSLTNTINITNAADLTLPKNGKKKHPPDLAKATRMKEKNSPEIEPEVLIKEEVSSEIALEHRFKEEDAPDLITTARIKEEYPLDITAEVQIPEEEPPDLATALHIKRKDPLAQTEIVVEVPPIGSPKKSRTPRDYTININDSPQTRYLKRSLKAAQETIREQGLQVKRFRENNRKLTKKIAKMENIIKCLREQSADK